MKKRLITGLLLSTMVFTGVLAGCGAKEDDKEEKGKVKGTITVVTSRVDGEKVFEEVEKKFKEKYPEVEDVVFESSSDYDNHIRTRMNTKDYGDVLFIPFSMNANPKEYADFFEPLGKVEELEKQYIDVTEADYDGIAYGIPTALNSLGIIYNEDVLKEAGVEKCLLH